MVIYAPLSFRRWFSPVPQKTVRNMSTKDNPGTLPINLYLTEQPTSQPIDFGKIEEVQGETIVTAREGEDQEQSNNTLRRSRRARKRANFDEFMCYDD